MSADAKRFTLCRFNTVLLETTSLYLVKGLIPRAGITVVWGPPKSGKSFWVYDLSMYIAMEREYRGRRVHPGPVVYLALEGGAGFRARIEAFRQQHNVADAPFYLLTDRTNLIGDHGALVQDIKRQLEPAKPVLVVIDTLNRSLAGSENKDEDMAKYIAAADSIRDKLSCAVIIVHHCGVDGTRPRGHTSLTGACDAQLAVSRDDAQNVVVEVEWMKDGPEGDRLVSRLEPIEVGQDEDGDPITSCVVVPVEGEPVRSKTDRKLSDRQRLALAALAEVAVDHGKTPPSTFGLPAGLLAIEVGQWRSELFSRGILDQDAKSPREDFRRVKNSLQARSLIGIRDDLVWRAA